MDNISSTTNSVRVTRAQRLLCNSNDPCSFSGYKCSLARVEGFEFCFRHILEDKSSPFRQCTFTFKNSKRCFRPASKSDKSDNSGLCLEHSRQHLRKRQKTTTKKEKSCSVQSCLNQLSHHLCSADSTSEGILKNTVSSSGPINDISLEEDCALDVRLLVRAEDDSEFDSADSDVDYLEHAGVFTTEEASRIYLQKLQKLKRLYNDEYNRLFCIFKEGRRKYLSDVKTERESMSNIHSQPKCSYEERELYNELKCLSHYHRSLGKEALLYKQMNEKRAQASEGTAPRSASFNKCSYSEGSWRCGVKCVPSSRFCFKHILQDEKQVLFQACGVSQPGGEKCGVPVFPHPLHQPKCVYHTSCSDTEQIKFSDDGEGVIGSCDLFKPKVIDFLDNGSLVISEVPPENILSSPCIDESLSKDIVKSDDPPK